jgi:hypothetical protein
MRVVGESGQASYKSISMGLMGDLGGNEVHLWQMDDARFI